MVKPIQEHRDRSWVPPSSAPKTKSRLANLPGCFSDQTQRGPNNSALNVDAKAYALPTLGALTPTARKPMNLQRPGLVWHRSRLGRQGIWTVSDGANQVVVKGGPGISREIIATKLAQVAGLPSALLHVEQKPANAVRRRLGHDTPAMVMTYLKGRSFTELNDADMQLILRSKGQPNGLLHQLGRVVAFDYLLRNPDRFGMTGLDDDGVVNRGNLMLVGGRIVPIDHTLPPMLAHSERHKFAQILQNALKLLRDPNDPAANAALQRMVQIFPETHKVDWDDVRADVVSGFCDQARLMAQLRRGAVEKCCAQGKSSSALKQMLLTNLECFQKAVG